MLDLKMNQILILRENALGSEKLDARNAFCDILNS